jgi:hypothetical protein
MTFFLDLWHDLREKRLWPVAVGLLAATVAIPLIMLKPASEASEEPTVIATTGGAEAFPALDVDTSPSRGSKLESFDQRNPFRPLSDLEEEPGGSGGGSGGGSSDSGAGGSTFAGGDASGSASGGDSSGGSGGSGGGATPPGIDPDGPSVQWFRYTADIRFGTPGSPKKMKGVQSLTLLPDDDNAAIVFMGVSDDAKSAIFFIADPAFHAEGEGECNSDEDCRFVKLGLDEGSNEHSFISQDGGMQYDLELLELNRENISADDAKGDATDAKAKPAAQPASTMKQVTDVFLPRLLYGPGVTSETE